MTHHAPVGPLPALIAELAEADGRTLAARLDEVQSLAAPVPALLHLVAATHGADWSEVLALAEAVAREVPLRLPRLVRAAALAQLDRRDAALAAVAEALTAPALLPDPLGDDRPAPELVALLDEDVLDRLLAPAAARLAEAPVAPGGAGIRAFAQACLAPRALVAATHLERALAVGFEAPDVLLLAARACREADEPARALLLLDRAAAVVQDPARQAAVAAERQRAEQGEQLVHARRVVLGRGDLRLEVRTAAGVYLCLHNPASGLASVEACEATDLGQTLREVVDRYLDVGFTILDWTLEASHEALETELLEAHGAGQPDRALRLGRRLILEAPDDVRLATLVLAASVSYRGYAESIPLSQRILALADQPDWALRQHAALLWAAGQVDACVGTLQYLREFYGTARMTPATWDVLASCFIVQRHRPTLAQAILGEALEQHPGNLALTESLARSHLYAGDAARALALLQPLLADAAPPAQVLATALRAHLDGGVPGGEQVAARGERLHPKHGPLLALRLELEGKVGPALRQHRTMLGSAPSPAAELIFRLHAMRAAHRLGVPEDALQLAREAQTVIGEPDARCLRVILESLRALDPDEAREDLVALVQGAEAASARAGLTREETLRAMLVAGLHLDPDRVAETATEWMALAPAPGEPRPQLPAPVEGLVCTATGTGLVVLADLGGLAPRLGQPPWDWYRAPGALRSEVEAGRLALAPAPGGAPVWIRLTTRPLANPDRGRYRPLRTQTFTVRSGLVYLGPGEGLLGAREGAGPALDLATDLGGRRCYLPPGRYTVTPWLRTATTWSLEDVRTDPYNVVFHLQPGRR
jgi:hypothetical protein